MRPLFFVRHLSDVRFILFAIALSSVCFVAVAGCERSGDSSASGAAAEHDADDVAITEADVDMPRDYAAAVERLTSYSRRIKEAVAKGRPHYAHRPLDEMDMVISKLMPIARDSGVARPDWEEVNLARRALRAQFDPIHAAIDGGKTPDVAGAEPGIDAALARLTAVAAKLSPRGQDSASEAAQNAQAAEVQP
jgi:hypothetical protein